MTETMKHAHTAVIRAAKDKDTVKRLAGAYGCKRAASLMQQLNALPEQETAMRHQYAENVLIDLPMREIERIVREFRPVAQGV